MKKLTRRDPSAQEDSRLVERCRKGDARAWEKLVEKYRHLVYSMPRRMGLNEDESADVFQQTFLALYTNLDRIEDGGAVPRWLAVTAARESLRALRFARRDVSESEVPLEEVIATEDATAEKEAVRAVEAEAIWRAVDSLGGRCAALLRMLFTEENPSYEEISRALGMPVGAIGPTRARCLKKLREKLEKLGYGD
ncbi:MAG: sigma-70 family RNA polymerase sigma factor [Armatimonadetes bacterium]|nr:MAG: sigma-70 family RNA polymerase sigma factor [Armatimonadota bacterium]